MSVRRYFLAVLALGMALVLLFHFGCIWVYGEFVICESNTAILIAETCGMLAIVIYSGYCVLDQLRDKGR